MQCCIPLATAGMPEPDLTAVAARVRARVREAEAGTDAYRIFHGRGGAYAGLDALVIDRYGDTLRIGLHERWSRAATSGLADVVRAECSPVDIRGAWLQWRGERGAPCEVLFGEPQRQLVAYEEGLAYHVRPGEARHAGLFLDARPARRWLRDHAADRRVLNLFAYTCAFSLAALAGGARSVMNVDMVRSTLATGQRNHAVNGFTGAQFLPHDVWKSRGALRKRGPFDVVVLDPPSFQRGSFEANRDWPRLFARLADWCVPGGEVLLLVNSPFIDRAQLETWRASCAPAFVASGEVGASPDFPESEPERGLKVLRWRRVHAAVGG